MMTRARLRRHIPLPFWILIAVAFLVCRTASAYDARFRLAAKTAPANAFTRTHGLSGRASSRNVNEIAGSMRASGWQGDPIKVLDHNGTKYILDGHHRVEAARRVGIEIPYQTVAPENLGQFGYKSVEQVIQATSEAGPVRLR